MSAAWPKVKFSEFLKPNSRPYTLGPDEDANLVGMRLYGAGPFHRELKSAMRIAKKTHFVIKTGDIIYNKLFAWKGTFGIVPPELDGMFVSDKFPTYELDRTKVDQEFLAWYFRCRSLWEEAQGMSTGSAAFSKLTLNPPKFLLLTMPLPSLQEQHRIAKRIEKLAPLIYEARTHNHMSSVQTEAIIRSLLRKMESSIRISGRLGDILVSPPRNGWSANCDNMEGGTAVLSLGAVTGFRYRSTEFKKTSLATPANGHFWLKPGDLLITRSNTPELVGHAAIYNGTPAPCIYPDLMMRLDNRDEIVDKKFIWYWLQSPFVREYIAHNAKGTSPTMKKISQGVVLSIPFPSDLSLSDQRRIVVKLDNLQTQVDALKRLQAETVSELDAVLPSILDKAFKGEL